MTEQKKKVKEKKKFRVLKFLGITILLLVSAVAGGGWGYVNYLTSLTERPTKEEFNQENIVQNEEVTDHEEYWTCAIFGVDARDSTLGKGNRSDSIIIASMNTTTKEVKLTSVYRDTLVEIPDHGYDKLTHAYAFGGPELAINTLNRNLDLNIKDYITVNFAVAEDIIDLLGGIEIDIQPNEVKWLNGYVHSLAGEGADTNVKYISGSGRQVLSGSQAVAYSRIRYTAGGDYKRAKRQRTVLNAALEKAKTCGIGTLNEVIQAAFEHIYTNLTTKDMLSLAKDVMAYEIKDSQGFPYHVKNARTHTYSFQTKRTAVEIPMMLAEDVKTLHYQLYNEGTPSSVEATSDSYIEEDNGVANQTNGYDAGQHTSSESTTENGNIDGTTSSGTTQQPITDINNSFEPSATVQTISQYLASMLGQ